MLQRVLEIVGVVEAGRSIVPPVAAMRAGSVRRRTLGLRVPGRPALVWWMKLRAASLFAHPNAPPRHRTTIHPTHMRPELAALIEPRTRRIARYDRCTGRQDVVIPAIQDDVRLGQGLLDAGLIGAEGSAALQPSATVRTEVVA